MHARAAFRQKCPEKGRAPRFAPVAQHFVLHALKSWTKAFVCTLKTREALI
ncbi:hypothetical protein [Candidatus Burkholderia verschuerenii]|uniref:hypothetical protein n=1 Tax=Candidatus Burkholderia verschuerenii TaxID=242163 RepID=UPI000A449356|nr:hypothetical protein [Candidatus Burkholderia verschuerenii]